MHYFDIIILYFHERRICFFKQTKYIMNTARNIIVILTITAVVIICGFLNLTAGYAFCCLIEVENPKNINLFHSMGISLLLSSLFLTISTIVALLKKILISLIFNIIGSAFYIYTVSELYAIPHTALEKSRTEFLAERHMLTVIVTLLLFALIIFNYFDEKNVNRRKLIKEKAVQKNRELTSEEKIL